MPARDMHLRKLLLARERVQPTMATLPHHPAPVMTALKLTLALLSGLLSSGLALAQDYPSHPVHLSVHNNPGSAPDLLARYVGKQLTETWKQPVVIGHVLLHN